jgi:hypothetical protein
MVGRDILVHGVEMDGTQRMRPVLLEMHDDDFPVRFLRDLASPHQTPISSTGPVQVPADAKPAYPVLYQPVQLMLNVAMVKLSCDCPFSPRIDPRRILSAGLVVRRAIRRAGVKGGPAWDDVETLKAWMKDPTGKFGWRMLPPNQADLDPDPTQRPQLSSGQAEVDAKLALMAQKIAYTESTTPAFAAPPAVNSSLDRTIVYAVIPTASSEVCDTEPASPPNIRREDIADMLPALLLSNKMPVTPPIPKTKIDFRWMTDDFLNQIYPPISGPSSSDPTAATVPDPRIAAFHMFSTSLRLLQAVFGAFDGTDEGNAILNILNGYHVTIVEPARQRDAIDGKSAAAERLMRVPMGIFLGDAKTKLLDYDGYGNTPPPIPTVTMPTAWDPISGKDEKALVDAMLAALVPKSQAMLAPQGRFQDETRVYRLRLFFRLKPENPCCPTKLVWSHYSEPFRIAAWHESSMRPHPPIALPDPTLAYMNKAKPNCAFHVPASLMNAVQGTTLSGLMKGSAGGGSGSGGGGLSLGWICGFNIPLITICAFFVLSIFLALLNIIFFWLPFIKICIPFPSVSTSSPDEGAP